MQDRQSAITTTWDEYNLLTMRFSLTIHRSPENIDAKISDNVLSYTHDFFEKHNLAQYLNVNCNYMLQLGASNGKFLADYNEKGWNVLGYDFSQPAINYMIGRGVGAKKIDLNAIDESGELNYKTTLSADISSPVNILIIRTLQHLDINALNLLLFAMIDNAAPGSVFFIADCVDQYNPATMMTAAATTKTRGYKASFFGARTDMEFLKFTHVNADDELLVIRKR
jgi:hypothetical protein